MPECVQVYIKGKEGLFWIYGYFRYEKSASVISYGPRPSPLSPLRLADLTVQDLKIAAAHCQHDYNGSRLEQEAKP